MAEFRITHTSDGRVKKELEYQENIFSYTMIPDEHGKTSDKKGFDYQVAERFPDEDEEVLDALSDIGFADEDEIEEILSFISEFE